MLPYFSGQLPMLRDRVSDSANLTGTVTQIRHIEGDAQLVVLWDDATTGINNHADGLVLVERTLK
jgi:hypothetical protein